MTATNPFRRWFDVGQPFWTAFTAFFANMVALLGLDQAGAITIDNSWIGSIAASLIVAAAVYGKEKMTEGRGSDGA